MQTSSAFFCSKNWFIRILCLTLQQNNKKIMTAIEMIAQIKRICSLALVIRETDLSDVSEMLARHVFGIEIR